MSKTANEPDLHALPRGQIVHRYMIEGVIGRGGSGITYRVRDNTNEIFALKEYFPRQFAVRLDGEVVPIGAAENGPYLDGLDRFLSEAQALRRLSAAGGSGGVVVKVFTFFEGHGTGYLVMEHLTGQRLDVLLAAHPQGLSEAVLNPLAHHLARGLGHVHGARFRHGDIKPANIMLREDGRPVLIDFGAARSASSGLTAAEAALASTGYAPIEQLLGTEQGPYSDVYALGEVLYQAIGGTPVDAITRYRMLSDGAVDPQLPAVEIGAGRFDLRLLRMIDRAAAVPHEARPQSAAALLALLAGVDADPAPLQTVRQPVEPPAADAPNPLVSIAESRLAAVTPLTQTTPAPASFCADETGLPPPVHRLLWQAMALPFLAGLIVTGLVGALAFFLLKPSSAPPASVPPEVASLAPPSAPSAHDSGEAAAPAGQTPVAERLPAASPAEELPGATSAEPAKPVPVETTNPEPEKRSATEPAKPAAVESTSPEADKPSAAEPSKPAAPEAATPPAIEPAKPAATAATKLVPVEPPKPVAAAPPRPSPIPPAKLAAATAKAPVGEPINRATPDAPRPPVPEPATQLPQAAISAPVDKLPEPPARDSRVPAEAVANKPAAAGLPDTPVGNRISGPALVYPPALEKNGREGSADVACTINADGVPSGCTVVRLWGPPDFGESALAYVRGSTYRPARRNGVNVSEEGRFHVEFRLDQ
jgi:TonB family protein